MTNGTQDLIRDALPLVGVVIGAALTAWLANRGEHGRWRRDWLIERIRSTQDYFGDALEAVDDQFRVSAQAAGAVRGERPLLPPTRVQETDQRWARVLARRGVSAPIAVQNALAAYDQRRAVTADAINSRDDTDMTQALEGMETERLAVLAAMTASQDEMNEELAVVLLPRHVIAWRSLRGRPLRDL